MINDRLKHTLDYLNSDNKNIVFTPTVQIIQPAIVKPKVLRNIGSGNKNLDTWRTNIKRRYGIDHIEYDRLLIAQNNKCAICGSETNESKKKKRLCVDHNHKTGKVRGLLCDRCNSTLGKINDDISTLANMISYLNKYQ